MRWFTKKKENKIEVMEESLDKHKEQMTKPKVSEQIVATLKTIFDPEIPVDIYELGLIYEIKIDDDFNVELLMTLTSPSCPVAETLPGEVEDKVRNLWSVKTSKVTLVWEPTWDKEMMSEEAKLELGFL